MFQEIKDNPNNNLPKYWLFLAISALAVAGLYALLLVVARSPYVQNLFEWGGLFQKALTIHVNLSVMVWILSISAMLWSLKKCSYANVNSRIRPDKIAFLLSMIGTVAMVISPFAKRGDALLNNYIPILDNSIFLIGLGLFSIGIFLQLVSFIVLCVRSEKDLINKTELEDVSQLSSSINLGVWSASFIAFMVFISFLLSFFTIDSFNIILDDGLAAFYEVLLWGSGHLLQFLYVQVMMVAWVVLAHRKGKALSNYQFKLYQIAFIGNMLAAFIMLGSYIIYSVNLPEHMTIFMDGMRYLGGVAPVVMGIAVLPSLLRFGQHDLLPQKWFLFWSVLMFAVGGFIALMISGVNTIIPAHYHGSVVGVTLSLMGLAIYLFPKFGFSPASSRMLFLQPTLYGGGQLLHIIGLAWSGGYGALRKTPGAMESIEGQAAMGLMGLGGLISIIGGLLFIVISYHAVFSQKNSLE